MKLRVPYWATDGFDVKLNGRSIAQSYQPSSYVEIPARRWKKDDVVEVTMPFTKHLDFGPDKTSPLWTGVLMYGPLVMATTGINSWDEATVDVASDLSNITLNGAQEGTGADAHLYTMTFAGHTFIPDYQADRNVTHYLRIDQGKPLTTHLSPLTTDLDKSTLHELILVAESRSDEQQAWNQMQVKVPEYAPWAPHAFARMMKLYEESRQLLLATDDKYSQEEIDKAASALSGIINSMRPGNLPELEDLSELTDLLEIVKQQPEGNEQQDRAIGYANMVIRYVSDGSGTKDMIERATRQLKAYIKQ